LLQQALAYRSFLNEPGGSPLDSYERMEFLGDAVLELVISTELYQRLPHLREGELTKSRAALVCRESLSQVPRGLNLGDFLLLEDLVAWARTIPRLPPPNIFRI